MTGKRDRRGGREDREPGEGTRRVGKVKGQGIEDRGERTGDTCVTKKLRGRSTEERERDKNGNGERENDRGQRIGNREHEYRG